MKNGIQSNKLVMVNGNGREVGGQDTSDDAAVDYAYRPESETVMHESGASVHTTLIVLMTVSIACTTAAIAAGSYAVWLSRHQAAKKTLIDVNDILKTCQSRMRQLEAEVQNLPSRAS